MSVEGGTVTKKYAEGESGQHIKTLIGAVLGYAADEMENFRFNCYN